ncbi:unnamed protein product [Debaryomyces fabryi]|nr:unnamed protein product [Debaryomyces fabryi]
MYIDHLCGKMFNNLRRYRSSRRIKIWNTGAPYKCHLVYLSSNNENHQKINFEDNANIKPSSIKNKVSEFLINLIKQETKLLADALIIRESEIPENNRVTNDVVFEVEYSKLDTKIKEDMERTADTYNKLVLILTYSPIVIHPLIYINFVNHVTTSLQNDTKKMILRRLAYHRKFEECWKIALNSIETLNDVDEYIETMTDELKQNNNLAFGIFELLSACDKIVSNPSLKHTIIETICHSNDLDKDTFFTSLEYKNELDNFETLDALENAKAKYSRSTNPYFRLLYFKRRIELALTADTNCIKSVQVQAAVKDILQNKEIVERQGWISSILSSSYVECLNNDINLIQDAYSISEKPESLFFEHFFEEYSKYGYIRVNDYDFLHILQYLKPKHIKATYLLYKMSFNMNSSQLNSHIINYLTRMILTTKDVDVMTTNIVDSYNLINDDILTSSLVAIFKNSKEHFKLIANKIKGSKGNTNKSKILADFINKIAFNKEENQISFDSLMYILKCFNKSDLASEIVLTLLPKMRKAEIDQNISISFYMYIIQNIRVSSYVLVEMARNFLLKERIFDEKLITEFLSTLLHRVWNKEQIMKRNNREKQSDDFQELFKLASKKERARFHNRIRALGQTLSLLETKETAMVFNTLYKFIFSNSFQFVASDYGKKYIVDSLIEETMRFINKANKETPKAGIIKMRDLLGELCFDSRSVQCALYKYMVEDDPMKCIKLLHTYENNKSYLTNDVMRSIMSGILHSPRLNDKEKLHLFKYFRTELLNLNFKSTIHPSTAVELLNLVISIAEKDPIKSIDSMGWVLDFANKKRIPKSIIAKFARRLKLHQDSLPLSIRKAIINDLDKYK